MKSARELLQELVEAHQVPPPSTTTSSGMRDIRLRAAWEAALAYLAAPGDRPPRERLTLNVNDTVRVRLTERGVQELRKQHEAVRKAAPSIGEFRAPERDAAGYSKFQLWSLMHDLGPLCYLGSVLPFDTSILLDAAPTGVRDDAPPTLGARSLDVAVDRFLAWPLPKDFAPDCGISFDGRKDDEWNKNKSWPIGTNLFTAEQARAMFQHALAAPAAVERKMMSAIDDAVFYPAPSPVEPDRG